MVDFWEGAEIPTMLGGQESDVSFRDVAWSKRSIDKF